MMAAKPAPRSVNYTEAAAKLKLTVAAATSDFWFCRKIRDTLHHVLIVALKFENHADVSKRCANCGEEHTGAICRARKDGGPPKCINCIKAGCEDKEHLALNAGSEQNEMLWLGQR
ncbi:hypothetical protein EVAR_499_1 [Eumeta japonica]|uniref:Uncharacterized protein n=1 Tax=Eumeta variegata TaxID=151549 RepID=A0A4C1SAS3_EUMVA|nr:hypothetical protein EVAR_499_1 [Eumeta japonica]